MRVKFLKPMQGYAYFANDVAELAGADAFKVVNEGFGALVPPTEGGEDEDSDGEGLPEMMPLRKLLMDNGYTDVDMILKNADTLTDVPGIGRKSAEKIIEFCKEITGGESHDDLTE